MARVLQLYKRLLAEYGPQGWWPADTQFEVVVGALLTQNTNWKNVEKAVDNLKMAGKLSPEAILKTQNPELETLIRPSGFYRQKAERLRLLTRKYSEILSRNSPPTREELLEVNGVGKETADSILLYAFGLPYFVIDAYTRRFCAHHRLFTGKDYDDYREYFEHSLPRSVPLYQEYHALIVRWGKGAGKIRGKKAENGKQGLSDLEKFSRARAP
ncbi:endonuclease III domain-containing protein [Candidatus Micrarchaeota archaeon]|nr:endonuclease III domain-containing protein [Candidatus Micrarchaeota archaeon]